MLPGLAIALALNLDPAIGGWLSGLAAALLAEGLILHKQQQEAVINTVLAGSLAGGVLLLSLLNVRVDLNPLFGDLLTAGWRDLWQTLLAAALSLGFLVGNYRALVFSGVDPDGAEAVNIKRLYTLLAVVSTLVIVSAIAAVGVILVIALLCAPAVVALHSSLSLKEASLKAAAIGAG